MIESLHWADLSAELAYAVLRLRVDVFVVEQHCAYPELDGRDLEPSALHVLARDGPVVTGCLRLLTDGDRVRVGRVCVAADRRGSGGASRLMSRALDEIGTRASVLDAQTHLQRWYAGFGYVVSSAEFLEDDIPHVQMTRPAS